MHIVDRIFERLGGPTAIASQTGDPVQTVHDWRINGNIPHWRRAAVVNAAHGLGKQLEPDMATYLGSRERAPKKDKPPAEAQAA